MATEFDMTGGQITTEVTDNQQQTGFIGNGGSDSPVPPKPNPQPQAGIKGLSKREADDPNEIIVEVSSKAPVVILFGAKTSGKTMTLIRLTQYLQQQGYSVEPDPIFRPAHDENYEKMCRDFHRLCNDQYAAEGTDDMSFMLVHVLDRKGKPICQLLEAPGEHYFDETNPLKPFPTYINKFLQLQNKRIWLIIVEKDWKKVKKDGEKDPRIRQAYAQRIQNLPPQVRRDKTIFVCHKVDLQNHLFLSNGKPNKRQLFESIEEQYKGIFTPYKNLNPITRWFMKYKFQFVPFSTGTFNKVASGQQVYTPGEDMYPRELWKAILKTVKG